MTDTADTAQFEFYPLKLLQHCLAVTWLVPHKTAAISAQVLCTPYNNATIHSVVFLKHCLAVTWLVPHKTAAISAQVLCTPYNNATVHSVTLFEAMCIHRVPV